MNGRGRVGSAIWLLLVAVAGLLLYVPTLNPTITWYNSGELVVAGATLEVPHPPGYPLFTRLAHLACRLPWGSLAWRINLLVAVLGVLGAVALAACLRMAGVGGAAAGLVAVWVLTAGTFWEQATNAEVYSLEIALLTGGWWWAASRGATGRGGAFGLGLCAGLWLTHRPTMLVYLPGLVWLAAGAQAAPLRCARLRFGGSSRGQVGTCAHSVQAAPGPGSPSGEPMGPAGETDEIRPAGSGAEREPPPAVAWGALGAGFVAGLLPAFDLYWRLQHMQGLLFDSRIGAGLAGFWRVFTVADFRGALFAFPLPDLAERGLAVVVLLLRDLGAVGVGLALLAVSRRAVRRLPLAATLAWTAAANAAFVANYEAFEAHTMLLPCLVAVGGLAGLAFVPVLAGGGSGSGAGKRSSRWRRASLWGLGLALLLHLPWAIARLEPRDGAAARWGATLLRSLAPGAVLVMNNDIEFRPVQYLSQLEGQRPDVTQVVVDDLAPEVVRQLAGLAGRHPLYASLLHPAFLAPVLARHFAGVPHGTTQRLLPAGQAVSPPAEAQAGPVLAWPGGTFALLGPAIASGPGVPRLVVVAGERLAWGGAVAAEPGPSLDPWFWAVARRTAALAGDRPERLAASLAAAEQTLAELGEPPPTFADLAVAATGVSPAGASSTEAARPAGASSTSGDSFPTGEVLPTGGSRSTGALLPMGASKPTEVAQPAGAGPLGATVSDPSGLASWPLLVVAGLVDAHGGLPGRGGVLVGHDVHFLGAGSGLSRQPVPGRFTFWRQPLVPPALAPGRYAWRVAVVRLGPGSLDRLLSEPPLPLEPLNRAGAWEQLRLQQGLGGGRLPVRAFPGWDALVAAAGELVASSSRPLLDVEVVGPRP